VHEVVAESPEIQETQPWEPDPIETDEALEEALREHAGLELNKTTGQIEALNNLVGKYQYMRDQLVARIEKKQAMLEIVIEHYARGRLHEMDKRQWKGAFGTVRLTKRKYKHALTDKALFIEWAEKAAPHLLKKESKQVVTVDRLFVDNYIKQKGEIPLGTEVQEEEGCTIRPDTTGLTGGS